VDARNRAHLEAYVRNVRTMERITRLNTNLRLLEKQGKIRRRPAPKGSAGAHYVYSAV